MTVNLRVADENDLVTTEPLAEVVRPQLPEHLLAPPAVTALSLRKQRRVEQLLTVS